MPLETDFNELVARIQQGRDLDHASFEPVYYLVFSPSEILTVKRSMHVWRARLKKDGWKVGTFSIAENINEILENAVLRKIWMNADKKAPQNWKRTNDALTNALNQGLLLKRLENTLEELQKDPKSMLFVTDLEALHPYMRIGSIESKLYGQFKVPTVFLYPGERTGKTRLKFMGFYPEDGNYRSVHVGGN